MVFLAAAKMVKKDYLSTIDVGFLAISVQFSVETQDLASKNVQPQCFDADKCRTAAIH